MVASWVMLVCSGPYIIPYIYNFNHAVDVPQMQDTVVQTKVCIPVQSGLVELGVANHVSTLLIISPIWNFQYIWSSSRSSFLTWSLVQLLQQFLHCLTRVHHHSHNCETCWRLWRSVHVFPSMKSFVPRGFSRKGDRGLQHLISAPKSLIHDSWLLSPHCSHHHNNVLPS